MVSMVSVPYGINPNFDIVPRVMVTSLRKLVNLSHIDIYIIKIKKFKLNNKKKHKLNINKY
ncbi:hypothetical protein BpHYR1_024386 [Brachionus plicatilis]|uniref:Uncharacterized protein n=1 Tax=Brachionus plicatilis TaxID=10195 RepID=A0A3M7R6U8_BRAPC|nr:hypothetical protein BpHYR1_024386 [Brachionus plicatilis]